MTIDRSVWRRARSLAWTPLAAVLAASVALALLPPWTAAPLRNAVATAMAPGQKAAAHGREWLQRSVAQATGRLATAAEQQQLVEEVERLRRRNAELQTALALAAGRREANSESMADTAVGEPLLQEDLVPARVLGPPARAFLERLELLDVGETSDAHAGSLVLGGAAITLDQGRNAGLEVDDLALAGRQILGKLVEVGAQTSLLRRTTDAGYRDLVQLAHGDGQRLRRGACGVLEGTGEPLCRIRMVEANEPVEKGDLILSAAAIAGTNDLVYGRVERVERGAGDAHWRIWMRPAAAAQTPCGAAVLRLKPNPVRIARSPTGRRSE